MNKKERRQRNPNGPQIVLLYARRSTDRQELSVESQLSRLREVVRREGHTVFAEMVDDAMSGSLDNRPNFEWISAQATSDDPPFDKVYVYDMSRLSRSLETRVRIQREFVMNGVGIVSITQPFQEGPDGDLHRNVVAVFDDHQLKQLSSLSRRGLEDVVLAGGYIGSKAPFGYIRVKKVLRDGREHWTLENDPVTGEIFRIWIKEPALRGITPLEIAISLNDAGIPSPGGKGWGKTVVTAMLKKMVYTGTGVLGERQSCRFRPKTDPIYVPGSFPALMTMDEYKEIQRLLASRDRKQKAARSTSSDWVYSGMPRCDYCDKAMRINGRGEKGRRPKLRCGGKEDRGTKSCPNQDIDLEHFDTTITRRLREHTLGEQNLREKMGIVAEGSKGYREEANLKLKSIQNRKAEIGKERDGLRMQIREEARQGRTVPQLGVWLNELDAEEARLDAESKGLDEEMRSLERFLNDERRIIDSARERATFLQSKEPSVAKRFIESFIKEIRVRDNVATIHYTIPMPVDGGVEKSYVESVTITGAPWPIDTPGDEGVMVELGMAIALNKPTFLFRDDFRRATDSEHYPLNLMLFTGLPEDGWEDYYYTSVEEITSPYKALARWAAGN